ncbi:MAG TPA: hypothetical protein VNM40_00420 [Candidatus Paceibacterota bacterium]|nr:hypothetical protein [Candidatus Paceibacterota bacterium]
MRNALIVVGIGALILAGGWWYLAQMNTTTAQNEPPAANNAAPRENATNETSPRPGASIGDENFVEFACDNAKKITAVFARDIVGLTLSDGRQIELRQEPDDAMRYLNPGATIEFRAVGEGAALIEGGRTTFANCVAML